jgi:hypothetical protein
VAESDLDEVRRQLARHHSDVREHAGAQPHFLMDLSGPGGDTVLGGMAKAAEIADEALEEDPDLADVRGGRAVHGCARLA